ncbi:MAG TPA: alpha/beta fold hydrolase [Acidimicrobiia bacterium]|jgi:pimeloyl-ACP methyl ester carboxylesterase
MTELRHVAIHGNDIGYQDDGDGPAVILVHGMASSSQTWQPVFEPLARRVRVVAPDLLGHGATVKPRTDYSVGAHANTIRDLMAALGIDRATIVGHSLGGGVAMQFAYQFPERCERLVLVAAGGLGPDVAFLLRALTLPGAEYVLALACHTKVVDAGGALTGWMRSLGVQLRPSAAEVLRCHGSLTDAQARDALVQTLRSVIDVRGQRVSATNRLYLARDVPTLIVWGDRDTIIPVSHAYAANAALAHSRLELFEGAGHFPHCDQPRRFVELLLDFIENTEPASDGDAASTPALPGVDAAS